MKYGKYKYNEDITFLVINYNNQKWLRNCLDSIKKNENIYFVDDCSTDNSILFVERNYPKIKIIKQEKNVGPFWNRILGIKKANIQTKYLRMIDADDWLLQNYDFRNIINKDYDIIRMRFLMNTDEYYEKNGEYFRKLYLPEFYNTREEWLDRYLIDTINYSSPVFHLYKSDLMNDTVDEIINKLDISQRVGFADDDLLNYFYNKRTTSFLELGVTDYIYNVKNENGQTISGNTEKDRVVNQITTVQNIIASDVYDDYYRQAHILSLENYKQYYINEFNGVIE